MLVIDCRLPVTPQVPVVVASRDGVAVSTSNRQAAARHVIPGARRNVNDLDYLTMGDRDFINAVTGEVIWPGQDPADRPVSAFAMQIAVDRRTGRLPVECPVSASYLRSTGRRLTDLGVPANPFSGALLAKALGALGSRAVNRGEAPHRVDTVC